MTGAMTKGDNEQTVLAFIGAVNRNDKHDILAFFRADSVFHNIPMQPAVGPEAIWKIMERVHGRCSAVNWKLHSIAESSDGSVLTERTDRYLIDGEWIEYPLMGIFELDGAIISAWREYFDLQQHVAQKFDFSLQQRCVPIPE